MPRQARDLDIACEGVPGWRLFEMVGRIENDINAVVDILPLSPPTPFTRMVERRGRVLI
ncbi:MAG: hypothetical protein HZA20_03045 [Nitrospirae bacterium]|nr:hypothetical protein [Nitrospirota bacterium]